MRAMKKALAVLLALPLFAFAQIPEQVEAMKVFAAMEENPIRPK
jgi:hypothetical protein